MTTGAQSAGAGASGGSAGSEVVVHMMDGRELRGTIPSFNSRFPNFVLHTEAGVRRVAFDGVKTVSFPHASGAARPEGFPSSARLVTVRFRDDSTLRGVSENFGGPRSGMFLVPMLPGEAIERVYIPVSAVRDMESVQRLGDILTDQKSITFAMLDRALLKQTEQRAERLGEILLRQQSIDADQLEAGLALQREREGSRIGEILVEQGFISREELEGALVSQKRQRDRKLGEVMIELGYTTHKMIAMALSIQYSLPFLSLASAAPDPSLTELLSREESILWQLVPLGLEGEQLTVAVADPRNDAFVHVLERRTGAAIAVVVSTPQDIRRLTGVLYPPRP